MGREICESCLAGEEHLEGAASANLEPLLRSGGLPLMNPWS
jgi:hypothetical protein